MRARIAISNLLASQLRRIIVVFCLAFVCWRILVAVQVDSLLDEISRRGEPADAPALNASYSPVPDTENAALMWLAGYEQLVSLNSTNQEPWSTLKLPPRTASPTLQFVSEAKAIIASNHVALGTFRRAASLTKCRYPVDLSQDCWLDLPHLSKLNSVARLLRLEACIATEAGDFDSAISALVTVLAAAQSLKAEPTGISMSARFSLDTIAFETLQRLLNNALLTEGNLEALASAFASIEDADNLARVLKGERALIASRLRNAKSLMSYMDAEEDRSRCRAETKSTELVFDFSGFVLRDLRFCLSAFETAVEDASTPDPVRFARRGNWEMINNRSRSGYYVMSSLLLAPLPNILIRDVEHRARARVAQVAIAVERYRAIHGTLPSELAFQNRKSATLVDPFDGQPIRFERRNGGYIVYSIGRDAFDDGGIAPSGGRWTKNQAEDLTFIVER